MKMMIMAARPDASLRAGDWIGGRLQTAGELIRRREGGHERGKSRV